MQWKAQERKKALCIIGARQIGKTTLIREFGKRILDQKAKDIFEGSFDADTIITNLTYRMYPMDFEEYLWANGIQDSTIEHLQDCFASFTPITELI